MADKFKPIEIAPGVLQVGDHPARKDYIGMPEALIAAGLCRRENIPVLPKRVNRGHDGDRSFWTLTRQKGGTFLLMYWRAGPRPFEAERFGPAARARAAQLDVGFQRFIQRATGA